VLLGDVTHIDLASKVKNGRINSGRWLSAATLSSMMFAIMDVVDPYQGLYNISSKNMHQALDAMLRQNSSVNAKFFGQCQYRVAGRVR